MSPDAPETPGPAARRIYRYHDGARDVCADPAVLWRGINAACVGRSLTWDDVCSRWMALAPAEGDGPEAAAGKAAGWLVLQETVAAVVREAFRLAPLDEDGGGLVESEVIEVLADFVADREKKGEPTAISPSSSAPTAGGRRGSSRGSSARSATPPSTASH